MTVATLELPLLQVTHLLEAFSGQTVAYKYADFPAVSVFAAGEIQIEDTSVSPVTLTVQEALFPLPSAAVAVIFAEPLETAVTTPLFTLATLLFELVQFMLLLLALLGQTVAEREAHCPYSRERLVRFSVTDSTGTVLRTVTVI